MIVCIEGPDRAGKTTLVAGLRKQLPHARFVEKPPLPAVLEPHIDLLMDRTMAMWRSLHCPATLYISDRSPFVSGHAYAKLRGNAGPDVSGWYQHVRVLFLAVPREGLLRRHIATGDDAGWSPKVLDLLADELLRWSHVVLDGTQSPDKVVADAVQAVQVWEALNKACRLRI